MTRMGRGHVLVHRAGRSPCLPGRYGHVPRTSKFSYLVPWGEHVDPSPIPPLASDESYLKETDFVGGSSFAESTEYTYKINENLRVQIKFILERCNSTHYVFTM